MSQLADHEYQISIDNRILELLGPNLYTNIYYVLAELIANAYDANAHDVYIIDEKDKIIVEDNGNGMSYDNGDIAKYLNVAAETRKTAEDSYVQGSNKTRRKIGRKGIGKLSALSVSDEVNIKTICNGEKSGFVLSRHIDKTQKLKPIPEKDIKFKVPNITHGTSVVMLNPKYDLHKTTAAIKKNLIKLFPLIDSGFKIHIKTLQSPKEIVLEDFNEEIITNLGALITLGDEFKFLAKYFDSGFPHKTDKLLNHKAAYQKQLTFKSSNQKYTLEVKGWIGAYRTSRGRKAEHTDFPDNFLSIIANGKLGDYNILPIVGQNRLGEVYVVGQLHADLFEETTLPDMALSNRQGYKSDDPRYIALMKYISKELLPEIIEMRTLWATFHKAQQDSEKMSRLKKDEDEFRGKVEKYKETAASEISKELIFAPSCDLGKDNIKKIVTDNLNGTMAILGIKQKIDAQKKKILISHSGADKPLADLIFNMLEFNNVPYADIIYTNSEHAESRVPEGTGIFSYLRKFFVDSYSTEKIYVIYVTSKQMSQAWNPVTEVGAGWITKRKHKIFNSYPYHPQAPLDIASEWHTSSYLNGVVSMTEKDVDIFAEKIIAVCSDLNYQNKTKVLNKDEIKKHVTVVEHY